MPRYFLLNKPYGTLSQFTREADHHLTLADLNYDFPSRAYPVGRLDRDSEGLLLLTDDSRLNDALLNPARAHRRGYHVLVEGSPTPADLRRLAAGPAFRVKKRTVHPRPLRVMSLAPAVRAQIPSRDPPVRTRKFITDTWLRLELTEGKNRQVRRMCAAVGFPVLRLIRHDIEAVSLADLDGKVVHEVPAGWLMDKLNIRL